jgi:hypothetical protein
MTMGHAMVAIGVCAATKGRATVALEGRATVEVCAAVATKGRAATDLATASAFKRWYRARSWALPWARRVSTLVAASSIGLEPCTWCAACTSPECAAEMLLPDAKPFSSTRCGCECLPHEERVGQSEVQPQMQQ